MSPNKGSENQGICVVSRRCYTALHTRVDKAKPEERHQKSDANVDQSIEVHINQSGRQ